jgi:hypothetical protein
MIIYNASGGTLHHKLDKWVAERMDRGRAGQPGGHAARTTGFGGTIRQHGTDEPKAVMRLGQSYYASRSKRQVIFKRVC